MRISGLLLVSAFALTAAPTAAQDRVLTLGEAMELVESSSLDVEIAESAIGQADRVRRQARSLLRPTIALGATYTLRDEELEFDSPNPYAPLAPFLDTVFQEHGATNPELFDPTALTEASTSGGVIQNRHDVMGTLTIDQSLFNARAMPLIRQARLGIRQAENNVEMVVWQLEGAVTQAYFAAVLQQRLVTVAERNAELARIAHESAVIAYEEEVGNRFEVNRTAVEYSGAQRDVDNARTAYAVARQNLATVLNIPADFDVTPPTIVTPPAATTVPTDHPQLVAHDLQDAMHTERVAETRARWYPTFFGRAQATLQRESAFGGDQFAWFIQIGANWTLYDGREGGIEHEIRQEDQRLETVRREQTLLQLQSTIDTTLLQIEQLERDVASARAEIDIATENVELTDHAVVLGLASALDAQVAREQLYLSELALAAAEVNLQAAIYEATRLTGGEPW